MLNDTKRDLITYAKHLGDYQSLDFQLVMDELCKAKDSGNMEAQNSYLATGLLRKWYIIDRLYQKSSHLGKTREDMFDWVVEGFEYACKYRAWQNPDKHTNADACVNQCINTIRLQHYYEYNLDKNRANYNTISLEISPTDEDNVKNTLLENLIDENENERRRHMEGADTAVSIVQSYINRNKIIEAIILDTIAFNDVERRTKKVTKELDEETGKTKKHTEYYTEFWAHKLVKVLSTLPEDYASYFHAKYRIKEELLDVALEKVRNSNNQKLYRYLNKCLLDARQTIGQED